MPAAPVLRVCAGPDPLHTGLPGLPAPAPARIVSRGGENRTGLRLRRGSGSAAAHAADGLPESGPAPAAPVSVPPPSLSTRVQRACRRVLRCWGLGWPLSPRVPSRPLPTRIQSSAHRAASRAARGRRGGSTMQAPVSHRLHGCTQRPPCRGIGAVPGNRLGPDRRHVGGAGQARRPPTCRGNNRNFPIEILLSKSSS